VKGISVVGIGKLGLCMAACFSRIGYRVIGVDIAPETVRVVNEGRSPIYEPGLAGLMKEAHSLSATNDYEYGIQNSDVTFIVVPTPSKQDGGFSTRYAEEAAEQIALVLRYKEEFHLVVLTSTVLPGATDGVIKPLLEKGSGKKCGADFGLCYNPEFIALGSVIRDFTNPDAVLIGESDPRSGELLEGIYGTVCDNHSPVVRTSIQNAELAKISLNAFVTMKISFANTLAEICERIPGGDVNAVTQMLGHDSRIGKKYLSGALGYGGPCFPRDNKAFAFFAKTVGCEARLPEASHEENRHHNERLVHVVRQQAGEVKDKSIAILGLTYKPNTDVVEESASIQIAKALLKEGAVLKVYDPAGMRNARVVLGDHNISYVDTVEECLKGADFCILATPWEEFKDLKPNHFTTNMKQPILLDCWRVFDRSEFSEKLVYLAIGLGCQQTDGQVSHERIWNFNATEVKILGPTIV